MAEEKGSYQFDSGGTEEVTIGVMVKGVEKVGARWQTTIMGRCRRKGGKPFVGCPLVVLRDARESQDRKVRTDNFGLFSCTVNLPVPGEYFVSALIEQTSIQAGEWVEAKADASQPKIPANLTVTISGPRGRQKLLISVTAEDGTPVSGFQGTVRDGAMFFNFTTGPDGAKVWPARFTERSRAFEVRAGNKPELVWRGRLLGPKPKPGAPVAPQP